MAHERGYRTHSTCELKNYGTSSKVRRVLGTEKVFYLDATTSVQDRVMVHTPCTCSVRVTCVGNLAGDVGD